MNATLTTERLVLEPLDERHLSALVPLVGDYEVAKNLTHVPHPYGEAIGRDWLGRIAAKRSRGDGETWAIVREGAFVGTCAFDRPEGRLNLGYWLGRPFWGQGYATEAARRALSFAFEALGEAALVSSYFEDNPASGRVLAKLGFEPAGFDLVHCVARNATVVSNRVWLERANYRQAA